MNRSFCFRLSLVAILSFAAGCGGGGQSGSVGPSQEVSISGISGPDHLQIGVSSPLTYVYSATVTGSSDKSVEWSVDDTSLATIDASTGVVTPSTSKTGTITISATANADASKRSTLQVKVVDWILADLDAYLLIGKNGSYLSWGSLFPSLDSYEDCNWSADSLKFICDDGSSQSQTAFYVFTTDGSMEGTRQIATVDLSGVSGLSWAGLPRYSPDGSRIVFSGSMFVGLNFYMGPMVMDASGTKPPQMLASDPVIFDTTLSSPRFTPDGREVIFAQSTGLWIVNADGTNVRQLAPAPAIQGLFSPDMSSLYYSANDCIYKANTDGSNPVCIFSGNVAALMDISPNGTTLVFAGPEVISTTGGNIYTVNTDGSNLQQTYGLDWASW